MKNDTFVTITSSDLDKVAGGDLLAPDQVSGVLTALGHTEQSVIDVQREFGLSPGGVFANGAAMGIKNYGAVSRAVMRLP
jgi:hypothetical protein